MKSVLLVVGAVIAGACHGGPNVAKQLQEKKPEMAAKITSVVKAIAANPPPLTADGLTGAKGPFTPWPGGNAAIVQETALLAITKDGRDITFVDQATHGGAKLGQIKLYGSIGFIQMAEWAVEKPHVLFNEYDDTREREGPQLIDAWAKLQYVIVLRVLDYKAPVVNADLSYIPGHLVGEALVYDTGGAPHGGFRIAATNSSEVKTSQGAEAGLALDLSDAFETAADEQMKKLAPGSTKISDFSLAGVGRPAR